MLDGYIVGIFGYSCVVIVDLILFDCCVGFCIVLDMGIGFDFFGVCVYIDVLDISVV